jgi:hypothetical protein
MVNLHISGVEQLTYVVTLEVLFRLGDRIPFEQNSMRSTNNFGGSIRGGTQGKTR